jgi:amino acid transporter
MLARKDGTMPQQPPEDAEPRPSPTERDLVRGRRLGDAYVRIRQPSVETLSWNGQHGTLQPADPRAPQPQTATDSSPAYPPGISQPAEPISGRVVLPGMEQRTLVPGSQLGGGYVRRRLTNTPEFRARDQTTIEATEEALRPETTTGRAVARVRRTLFGRRLSTAEEVHERLTKVKALAVLSSDAISSVAYGTEASLGILIVAGLGALHLNLYIGAAIALLMIVVGFSYRQTIHAYPHGGGSYIVARDNLGDIPGLVAAASLLIDYVLTVSVSVSSGVDALVSAVPTLTRFSVPLGVIFILFIMGVNLRGIRESGTIFAAPTYLFIACFLIMIITGVIHAALTPGGLFNPVHPTVSPQSLGWPSERLGILLVLTAFASGCSAMTGVEAISNGVPAFKAPESENAAHTLEWMIAILVTLFLGITYLAWRFGTVPYPTQNPTVDSQIASGLFVGAFHWFYYLVQFSTLLVLVLAANTSFADFPRLSSILARDTFLPGQFAYRGDRLAFNTGIVVLSALSAVLLVVFRGSTDALINLYALGVFTAFTLSQSGMVVRWLRLRDAAGAGWRHSMAINLVGAIATGLVAIVIMITKFDRGAWIVVILVPMLVVVFRAISIHYAHTRQAIAPASPLSLEVLRHARHIMIVPIASLSQPALRGLAYALSLTTHVVAINIATTSAEEAALRGEWTRWIAASGLTTHRERRQSTPRPVANGPAATPDTPHREDVTPQLIIIQSPYRSLIPPLVAYIDALRDANPTTSISVILPEFVPNHWWERLLHNQTAFRLKLRLYADPGVVVVNIPFRVPRALREQPATPPA